MTTDYDEYKKLHECCPRCGGDSFMETTMGFIRLPGSNYLDRNHAECLAPNCGWKGIVHNRVPRRTATILDPTTIPDIVFHCHDLGREVSIRDYFRLLARQCWREGEGFSGKRPFGNSGWEYDVCRAVAEAGFVDIEYDDEGEYYDCDSSTAEALIEEYIFGGLGE